MHGGPAAASLACCHGFSVVTGDRQLGHVETPVFSGTGLAPVALVVRTTDALPGRFRIVPVGLVVDVDERRQRVVLDANEADIHALHEFELTEGEPRRATLAGRGPTPTRTIPSGTCSSVRSPQLGGH